MLNADLTKSEFVHQYLDSNLKTIIGKDFLNYQLEIHQRYSESGYWIVEIKTKDSELKIVGLIKENKYKAKISFEIARLLSKKNKNFSVYRPLFYDDQLGIFFYEFVFGNTFRDLVENKRIDFPGAMTIVERVVGVLKEISGHDNVDYLGTVNFRYNIEEFGRNFEKYTNSIYSEIEKPLSHLRSAFQNGLNDQRFLCHGDFQSGNIILNNNDIMIIDWEDAVLGAKTYDAGTFLAHTDLMFDYHYGSLNSKKFIEYFVNEFNQNEEILMYCAYTYFKVADFLAAAYGREKQGELYRNSIPEYSKDNENFDLIKKIVKKADLMLNRY